MKRYPIPAILLTAVTDFAFFAKNSLIFPIPPNSDKKLEMTYTQVLKAESGTVAYRYPLGTGRNLWRNNNPQIENAAMLFDDEVYG